MAGETSSVDRVLAYFLTPILMKIDGELTQEGLIDLHRLVSGNTSSVALNLRGGRHGHLALTMTAEEYRAYMLFSFVPLRNSGEYPHSMGNSQEQVLGTEMFRQTQALF